jgi:hypothetical protein
VLRVGRGGGLQEFAGVVHHGTPQAGEIFGLLVAERVVLGPEVRDPAVNVSGRIVGVEVVEIVFGERLLGTLPHQICKPGDEDIADRVWIYSVSLGLVLDLFGLIGDAGLEVDVIEIVTGRLELCL